jgi:general secretion pathway protein B
MSSILDALERASQNRPPSEQELIPKGYEGQTDRNWRVWILSLVVVSICGLLIYQLFISQFAKTGSDEPQAEPFASSAVVAETQTSPNSAPGLLAKKLQRLDLESQLLKRSVPSERSLMSEAELSKVPKQPLQQAAIAAKALAAEPMSVAKVQQASPPANQQNRLAKQPPQAKEHAAETAPLIDQTESLPEVIEPLHSSPSVVSEPVEDESIPLVWELPQGQREALQQLKISIHVYHNEPDRRFVLINMRRYGEGDQLRGTDYRLKTIERDGVVIDYGDGLVRLLRERH